MEVENVFLLYCRALQFIFSLLKIEDGNFRELSVSFFFHFSVVLLQLIQIKDPRISLPLNDISITLATISQGRLM